MSAPLLSIILPAYRSAATLGRCLRMMSAQTYPAIEIIVVDSDPDPAALRLVEMEFPQVRYIRCAERLLPHAARNRGVELARGDLLLFSDPDIYPSADWAAGLAAVVVERGGAAVGALECYGTGWLNQGEHYAKFDKWLPGGSLRPIDIGPTAGLLCRRSDFEQAGGFEGQHMLADTLLSWSFTKLGVTLWFQPAAVAAHDHRNGWRAMLRERYERGRDFGELRSRREHWGRPQLLRHAVFSLAVPLRLAGLLRRGLLNAAAARQAGLFIRHSPVVAAGQAAWLAGETAAYAAALARPGGA